jgi:hypothetical protein
MKRLLDPLDDEFALMRRSVGYNNGIVKYTDCASVNAAFEYKIIKVW